MPRPGSEAALGSGAGDAASRRYCEAVFAPDLGGHPLISNRSEWRRFPVLACERWRHEKRRADRRRAPKRPLLHRLRHPARDGGRSRARPRPRRERRAGGGRARALRGGPAAPSSTSSSPEPPGAGAGTSGSPAACNLTPHEFAYDYMTRSGRVSDDRPARHRAPGSCAGCPPARKEASAR